MSMPGWPRATPSGPGNDRAGRAARVKTRRSRREVPPDLESEKIQTLRRIWNGFDDHDWFNLESPEPGTDSAIYRWAHHARGIRLLVEEMQKDTEVSAALRAELAASLRSVAGALVQQPPSDPGLDDAREQQQYGACDYLSARQHVSYAVRAELATSRLRAEKSDLPSMLRGVETLLHELQLSHLKAAVALSVQSPDLPVASGALVANFVQVADRLHEVADISRFMRKRFEQPITTKGHAEAARKLSEMLLEATRRSSRSTAELRRRLRRLVEDRLADDRDQSAGDLYSSFGGMLDLRPWLQQSVFDPDMASGFRSVGDHLTRSLITVWGSSDERENRLSDSEVVTSK